MQLVKQPRGRQFASKNNSQSKGISQEPYFRRGRRRRRQQADTRDNHLGCWSGCRCLNLHIIIWWWRWGRLVLRWWWGWRLRHNHHLWYLVHLGGRGGLGDVLVTLACCKHKKAGVRRGTPCRCNGSRLAWYNTHQNGHKQFISSRRQPCPPELAVCGTRSSAGSGCARP